MQPFSPDTLTRLKRAMVFTLFAFVILIVQSKIGYNRHANYLSPETWSEISLHLNRYLVVSLMAGAVAYFWPVDR
jgi:hypothetical protein